MRNELIEKSESSPDPINLIDSVMEESKRESLQRYEKFVYDFESGMGSYGWYNMLFKTPAIFTGEQFAVFRAVHQWRDQIARKEDESTASIMPKSILFSIAREMPLELPALMACGNPTPSMRRRATEILTVIKKAKQIGADGPDLKEVLKTHPATLKYEAERAESIRAFQASRAPHVGQVVQEGRPNVDKTFEFELKALRTGQSHFWGSTIIGQKRKLSNISTSTTDVIQPVFQIPLPQLTAEVFLGVDGNTSDGYGPSRAPPEHQFVKSKQQTNGDDTFVLREKASRKRKASPSPPPPSASAPTELQDDIMDIEVSGDEDNPYTSEQTTKSSKKARKQRKKEKKAREKAKAEADGEGGAQGEAEEPFDYSTAPSVLHPKKEKREKGGRADKGKKGFDPYKKSKDAPKGMRKVQREIQGKSSTFRG